MDQQERRKLILQLTQASADLGRSLYIVDQVLKELREKERQEVKE